MRNITPLFLLLLIVTRVALLQAASSPIPARARLDLSADSTPTFRAHICLDGLWDFRPARTLDEAPNGPLWGALQVPGRWDDFPINFGGYNIWNEMHEVCHSWDGINLSDYPAAWYRLEVQIPSVWKGRQLRLMVDHIGAGYDDPLPTSANADETLRTHGRLFWNGKAVNLEQDREGELPDNTVWGGTNTLIIGVQSASVNPRWGRGINGDVWLEAVPTTRVARAWTWIKEDQAHCQVEVRNDDLSPQTVAIRCEIDKDTTLAPVTVTVPPRSTQVTVLDLPRGNLPVWSPLHPTRVRLRVSLEDRGQTIDELERWSGFSDLRVKGQDITLNGLKIHFLTESGPSIGKGLESFDQEFMEKYLKNYRDANYNSFRTYWGDVPENVYDSTDSLGLMVQEILPSPQMIAKVLGATNYNEEFWMKYRARIARQIQTARTHPSLVAYVLWSHEASDQMQNQPHNLDGKWTPFLPNRQTDRGLELQAEQVIHELDPNREVFFDESGNFGKEINVHPYFDFSLPVQEWEDWPSIWAAQPTKPLMATEFGLPYGPSWCEWDPRTWAAEGGSPFFLEHAARYLGDRAYTSSPGSMVPEEWPATGEGYAHESALDPSLFSKEEGAKILRVNPAVEEVSAMFAQRVYRSWRTAGLHLGPFAQDTFTGGGMLFHPILHDPTSLDHPDLHSPGPKPNFTTHPTRSYEYGAMPFLPKNLSRKETRIYPTKMYEVTAKNFAPLLAYLGGGKDEGLTSKDHSYISGETLSKSMIVINDTDSDVTVTLAWQLQSKGTEAAVLQGTTTLSVAQGGRGSAPISFVVPTVSLKQESQLSLTASSNGHVFSTDQFALQIFPPLPSLSLPSPRIVLYDPIGRTEHLLTEARIPFRKMESSESWKDVDLLIVGAQSLTPVANQLIRASEKGVNLLVFEQNVGALNELAAFTGDRFSTTHQPELSTREAFICAPDHPILQGLSDEDFCNWRGSSDYVPENRPASLSYYLYAPGGAAPFKGSNRGVVSTWLLPKPQYGNYRSLLSAGFDESLSPLVEFLLPHSRLVWCQLDVTTRYGRDPVATRLVQNMIAYAANPVKKWNKTLYVGDKEGEEDLRHLHAVFDLATRPDQLREARTLVVGRGAATELATVGAGLQRWLEQGGHLILLPGAYSECAQQLSTNLMPKLDLCLLRKCNPPKQTGMFSGLSGADFYFRSKLSCAVLSGPPSSTWNLAHPGVVGSVTMGKGDVTVLQLDLHQAPTGPGTSPLVGKLLRIYCTVLTNAGVRLEEPFQLCPDVIDLSGPWAFHTDPSQAGEGLGWAKPTYSASEWKPMSTPGFWETQQLVDGVKTDSVNFPYTGLIWYRRPVEIPSQWKEQTILLHVGGISASGKLFLNGSTVAETPNGINCFAQAAEVLLPPNLWHSDSVNLIALKIMDNGLGGGITGPIYLYLNRNWLYRSEAIAYGVQYPNYDPESYHYW